MSTHHRLRHCSRCFTKSNLFNLYFKSMMWVQLASLFSRRKMDSEQPDNVHQFWLLVFYETVIWHRRISKVDLVLLTFMLYCHLVLPWGEVSNFIETGKFKPWITWWDGAKARVILSGHVVPRVRLFTKSWCFLRNASALQFGWRQLFSCILQKGWDWGSGVGWNWNGEAWDVRTEVLGSQLWMNMQCLTLWHL